MDTFSVGNIVILSSGGPLMTVTGFNEDRIHCKYFKFSTEEFIFVEFVKSELILIADNHNG